MYRQQRIETTNTDVNPVGMRRIAFGALAGGLISAAAVFAMEAGAGNTDTFRVTTTCQEDPSSLGSLSQCSETRTPIPAFDTIVAASFVASGTVIGGIAVAKRG